MTPLPLCEPEVQKEYGLSSLWFVRSFIARLSGNSTSTTKSTTALGIATTKGIGMGYCCALAYIRQQYTAVYAISACELWEV